MELLLVEDISNAGEFKLDLELVTESEGLKNEIKVPYVQKPGLAITGFTDFLLHDQIQILGRQEITYLTQLDFETRDSLLKQYFGFGLACCVITRNLEVPGELLDHAKTADTAIFRTKLPTHVFIERISKFLEARFILAKTMHGVLLDVHGVGILLLGKSGIGKSESALDLLLRGHRLVADDVVELKRIPPGVIRGQGAEVIKHHMEIRGLGVLNVKELFGIAAIRDQKKVHLVINLVNWDESTQYDRIGLVDNYYSVLGVDLPLVVLPVAPGRNVSAIIEVAAKNHLLKLEGYHPAKEFQKALLKKINGSSEPHPLEEPE